MTSRGDYQMADETFDELLEKLTTRKFSDVSAPLARELKRHFGNDQRLASFNDF